MIGRIDISENDLGTMIDEINGKRNVLPTVKGMPDYMSAQIVPRAGAICIGT